MSAVASWKTTAGLFIWKGEELFFPGHPLGAGSARELLNTELPFEPFFHEEGS